MLTRTLLALTTLAFAGLFFSFGPPKKGDNPPKKAYVVLANMDKSIAPGDDFFSYVHGSWLKQATIPASESRIGSFYDVANNTRLNVKSILEKAAAAKAPMGSPTQQIGDLYASGLDSTGINQRGLAPLNSYLESIAKATTPADVLVLEARWLKDGVQGLLRGGVRIDDKHSAQHAFRLSQAGLGLPDRDYYFKSDTATVKVIGAYLAYLQKTFQLLGASEPEAKQKADDVFAFEKTLAGSHRVRVALRDPNLNYNKFASKDLEAQFPGLGLQNLVKGMGVNQDSILIGQPDYFKKLAELTSSTPLNTFKAHLQFSLCNSFYPYLPQAFENAQFAYGKTLSGQSVMRPRWERTFRVVNGSLGDPLGQVYVKEFFPPAAKLRMDEMIKNLTVAMEHRIDNLDWMSDSTKPRAKAKLATIIHKIGYPQVWKDLSKVSIKSNSYLENVVACNRFGTAYDLAKFGKPVDKTEWHMTACTVNAYYNPTVNEIVFPAGILQFPFFDLGADDAINYGAIGLVIGHEITHGFDDQGSKYDKEGNLKNWWNNSDKEKFQAKGQLLSKHYSSFVVMDTLHVNGALTLGENMADLGGLTLAYEAFKLTKQAQGTMKIDGFTPDQRFFLGFAGAWRNKERPESVRQQILTDPHSPARFRVNGPLTNFTPFYTAFGVKEGQKLYRPEAERLKIW